MTSASKFPWTKFGFESLLIIASILIAFSIEGWRQDQANAEQEQVLLEALAIDFEQAKLTLESEKAMHTNVASYGEQIIHLADSGGVPESERVRFQAMVGAHFGRALFSPPMGTVQTILGSGQLNLISKSITTFVM